MYDYKSQQHLSMAHAVMVVHPLSMHSWTGKLSQGATSPRPHRLCGFRLCLVVFRDPLSQELVSNLKREALPKIIIAKVLAIGP